jgi:crossover junction endodeoxyribonuclease RuvC
LASQKGSIVGSKKRGEKSVDSVDNLMLRDFKPLPGSAPRPLLLGIDPGLSGAVAVVDMDRMVLVDMIDLPTFKKASQARKQGFLQFIDVHALSTLIDLYAPMVALAVLEEPGAMPEQGLSSTFRFGHICGQIHGVLAGHYVPVAPVKPGVWKSAMALSDKKDESRALATKHFPAGAKLWAQKQHNDRAEAALLTVYGKQYLSKLIKISR